MEIFTVTVSQRGGNYGGRKQSHKGGYRFRMHSVLIRMGNSTDCKHRLSFKDKFENRYLTKR